MPNTMIVLPKPMNADLRRELIRLAGLLAPRQGYNLTQLKGVRVLRTETVLHDVPVLYNPGAVFVCQGSKRGILDGELYRYDEDHYLAVSVPVPFRMESDASADRPLLAIYLDFDLHLATEIAAEIETNRPERKSSKARSLISSEMDADIAELLVRMLRTLQNPLETSVLGSGLLKELHFRVMVGPQGGAMIAALRQRGTSGRILESLGFLRNRYHNVISIEDLARAAGMSIPSYYTHFKELTGSSPMQYVKSMRLHEARLKIARRETTIADVATAVGYVSPSQFSRDFKRHFGRTASEEANWVRQHLGAMGDALGDPV
jgi:AraC-like DNA-binding protein